MRATNVTRPDGSVIEVKNLGWLLRYKKYVIAVYNYPSGQMKAILNDGTIYRTAWADISVREGWMSRFDRYLVVNSDQEYESHGKTALPAWHDAFYDEARKHLLDVDFYQMVYTTHSSYPVRHWIPPQFLQSYLINNRENILRTQRSSLQIVVDRKVNEFGWYENVFAAADHDTSGMRYWHSMRLLTAMHYMGILHNEP